MPTHLARRPGGRPPDTPPYGLHLPFFPFPALTRLASRAPLGGQREEVLSVLMGARLINATLPPYRLGPELRDGRVSAALAWLSALAIGADLRPLLQSLYESARGSAEYAPMIQSLHATRTAVEGSLDRAALAELDALRGRLTTAGASSSST